MRPQPIATPLTKSALFLVASIPTGQSDTVRSLFGDLPGLEKSVGFRYPDAGLSVVVGIGIELWNELSPHRRPVQLHRLNPIHGVVRDAPSTPGDLLFHIRSRDFGVAFEFANHLKDRFPTGAVIVDEVHGFGYLDQRDLLGFVDGTENPDGEDAAKVALIGDEDPNFAGGSYVIVQKYLHDIASWQQLTTEEQERAVGRTKLDNVELDDEHKASNSHVALNNIRDDEKSELKIYRMNMPFGNFQDGAYGTHFIGYARNVGIMERMLQNMFLGEPVGNYDRLLDFSIPITGGLFFCPSADLLEELAGD